MFSKKKKYVIIIIFLFIAISAMIIIMLKSGVEANIIPSQEEQEKLYSTCTWEMEYDDNGRVISEIVTCERASEPSQEIYYKYDKDGNRTEREVIDGAYDEVYEHAYYEYENGNISVKIESGNQYDYISEDSTLVCAKIADSNQQYRFNMTLTGRVMSVESKNPDYKISSCSYNIMGKPEMYLQYSGNEKNKYTYEYDILGRYHKIQYTFISGQDEMNLSAEFVYEKSSSDCVAFLYNEERELVGKYVYKYDKKGKLIHVKIFTRDSIYDNNYSGEIYRWGTTLTRLEYNYPGGEFPDNFFEL